MRAIAATLKESCSAAVLADEDVVYVARVPGERISVVALNVGTWPQGPRHVDGARAPVSGLDEVVELQRFRHTS